MGLFLAIFSALRLFPEGIIPNGTWLIAAGVIILDVKLVRYLNDIKLSELAYVGSALVCAISA